MCARPTLEIPINISSAAGKLADPSTLLNVEALLAAYFDERPDPSIVAQRVSFGTSGHRGSSFHTSFNEWHILAITQAICLYRIQKGIDGPLFIGIDTHALSRPAYQTALEVLIANEVDVMIAADDGFTPTPAISHAILTYNKGRTAGLADGIVITPSHNPPEDGGFKYNPPHGGPAESSITGWIQARANEFLAERLTGVKRIPFAQAANAAKAHRHDYISAYVGDLSAVLDMEAIRGSGLKLGVDPLGGAGVAYWEPIAERYGLDLKIVNDAVDPTFSFMTADWDGRIRMDPSSAYAMHPLIGLKDKFDIAFACDTDHDRHGIVAKSTGLLPANHYLAACIHYLFSHRPLWGKAVAIGKTIISSSMIDRVAAQLGRTLYEVPVGFKYFVEGLSNGTLGFVGEESAGASFLRMDGTTWTTDKDGIIAALLSAEMTARTGRDPGELYADLTKELGDPVYDRIDAPAQPKQKAILAALTAGDVTQTSLAGEPIDKILTNAPGDGSAIGGIKICSAGGWFAARPSGTEEIYKIYAESFRGKAHLERIEAEAQTMVDALIG